jgi:hypothetical protein
MAMSRLVSVVFVARVVEMKVWVAMMARGVGLRNDGRFLYDSAGSFVAVSGRISKC